MDMYQCLSNKIDIETKWFHDCGELVRGMLKDRGKQVGTTYNENNDLTICQQDSVHTQPSQRTEKGTSEGVHPSPNNDWECLHSKHR